MMWTSEMEKLDKDSLPNMYLQVFKDSKIKLDRAFSDYFD